MAPTNPTIKAARASLLRRHAAALEEQARCTRELADLEEHDQADPDVYGSRAPYAPCPGRSHRWSRDHIPTMPGARRLGGKRGRSVVWTISPVEYTRWLDARTSVVTPISESEDERIERAIADAGLRQTRRAS